MEDYFKEPDSTWELIGTSGCESFYVDEKGKTHIIYGG